MNRLPRRRLAETPGAPHPQRAGDCSQTAPEDSRLDHPKCRFEDGLSLLAQSPRKRQNRDGVLVEDLDNVMTQSHCPGATGDARQRRALRLLGVAFMLPAVYLLIQSVVALRSEHLASPSVRGIVWTAVTAIMMFTLAAHKTRTGRAFGNSVLITEERVTFPDGLLGITLDQAFGWWRAHPVAGIVIVYYPVWEATDIFRGDGA